MNVWLQLGTCRACRRSAAEMASFEQADMENRVVSPRSAALVLARATHRVPPRQLAIRIALYAPR